MDIPVAAPGTATVPWLVLGVVLGVLLVLLAGLAAALVFRRRSPRTGVAAPEDDRQDDLAEFLESPPGTAAAAPPAGWAVLTAAPPIEPAPAPRARETV